MKISVTGRQYDLDEKMIDELELITEVTVRHEKDLFIVDYTEFAEKKEREIRTRLRVRDNKMILTKLASKSSSMEFEIGKPYYSYYYTQYGDLRIIIDTKVYENNLNPDGTGSIHVRYLITIGNNPPYYNDLEIRIWNEKNKEEND